MSAFFMILFAGCSTAPDDMLETYLADIANGDKNALALLYEQTHAAVYGFAWSILKNRQDAEDVQHDVYLQIWKAAGSYQPAGKPMAWIFTITRNLARMQLRRQNRVITMALEDWQSIFADMPAVEQEDRLVLASLLQILSDEERQIVMLYAMSGMKHREIAALLERPLSTVLSKYHRAIKKLRNALKGGGLI